MPVIVLARASSHLCRACVLGERVVFKFFLVRHISVSLQAMLSTLLASALAAAPEKVLLTMRTSLAKDDLAAAISAGKTALQSCSADKARAAHGLPLFSLPPLQFL